MLTINVDKLKERQRAFPVISMSWKFLPKLSGVTNGGRSALGGKMSFSQGRQTTFLLLNLFFACKIWWAGAGGGSIKNFVDKRSGGGIVKVRPGRHFV